MEVRIESLLSGAKKAEGTVVVIDVYRAFTTTAVALSRGAEKLLLTADVSEAFLLRRQNLGDCCIGEVGGVKPTGFDFGNSPYEISQAQFHGQIPILSTRAGTVGVDAAGKADRIYGASLATAKATAAVLLAARPALVTLVPMGWEGRVRTDEDEVCAIYLKNLLQGCDPDPQSVRRLVEECKESQKFDDPNRIEFHPGDRDLALALNAFSFAVRVFRRDGHLYAEKEMETGSALPTVAQEQSSGTEVFEL